MLSQGQREKKESGGVEESVTVTEYSEGVSPASRAGNSRGVDVPRNSEEQVGDRVRALHEEVGPKRQQGESDQDRGANPAVVSTPSETS